jgi:hypothetical protein
LPKTCTPPPPQFLTVTYHFSLLNFLSLSLCLCLFLSLSLTHKHTHTHSNTHKHTYTHTHTHSQTHTLSHTHKHTLSHTLTHTQLAIQRLNKAYQQTNFWERKIILSNWTKLQLKNRKKTKPITSSKKKYFELNYLNLFYVRLGEGRLG